MEGVQNGFFSNPSLRCSNGTEPQPVFRTSRGHLPPHNNTPPSKQQFDNIHSKNEQKKRNNAAVWVTTNRVLSLIVLPVGLELFGHFYFHVFVKQGPMSVRCGCIGGNLSFCDLFIICLSWPVTILCSLESTIHGWSQPSSYVCSIPYISIYHSWVKKKKNSNQQYPFFFLRGIIGTIFLSGSAWNASWRVQTAAEAS